jgi:hypothetical protein
MANSIDLIVSKEAQAGLDALYKSLTKTHEEVVAISKLQLSFNGGSSPKSVTELNEKIKDQAKIQAQLEKQIEKNRLAEIRLQQAREKAFDKYDAQLQKEQAKLNASTQMYNKVQAKLNALNNEYKNLAIQKELSGKLSDSEAKRYEFLSGKITKYDQALKAVDGQMGKYTRNVGNYAGAFNPLSNSINQLSREMPAFANSVQTGFMAISNNLPIFFDAMGGIINQNKELQAQGKPTQSVFKQLATSIFSWGTALSVGVTLLTLYGKDIVKFIGTLSSGSITIKSASDNQKELNNAIKEGTKGGIQEASQLDILYRTATNLSLSLEQRNKAVSKMQEMYPSYFGNMTKEEILAGKAVKQYEALRDAIFDSARAKAIQSELEKRGANRLEDELSIREKIQESQNEIIRLQKSGNDLVIQGSAQDKVATQRISNADLIKAQQRALMIYRKQLTDFNNNAKKEDELLFKAQFEYYKKSEKLEADRIKVKETRTKKEKEVKREQITSIAETLNAEKGLIQTLEDQIAVYKKTQQEVSNTAEEYKSFQVVIDGLQQSIDLIKDPSKVIKTSPMLHEMPQAAEATKKATEEMTGYLKGFYDQFGSESGMPTLFKALNNEIEVFGDNWKTTAVAMMEIGQELTNTLMKQSEARFNAEYSRLEQQKDIAIAFAGDSTTAKAEIERQYEEKRKAIQRRQAEAEKRQAMFNIVINTAQAVIATLGQAGFAGIPLSLIVGAIGAAQLAMVASQEIPAFAEGGIHEGGKMLINDAKGSKYQETVVTPDGKVMQFKGRNKVVNAPKGTQIFTPDQWSKQINNLLLKNNISPLQTNQTNGINKEDLESVFRKYSGTNEVAIDINENGFKKMINSNGRTREVLNSRLITKGRIV